MTAPVLLLLLRLLQGAAIGGEVPGAWVFVAEHVPEKRIGFACGTLTAGLTAGILLGSLVATLIATTLSAQSIATFGWRIPFFLGGIFGLIALYLRRWLHETPVFTEMQARKALAQELPLKTIVRAHRRSVIVSMLLTWLLSACIVVVILMAPALLQKTYGLPAAQTLQANSLATVMLLIGCVVAGAAADRFGAGKTLMVGSLLLAGGSACFFYVAAAAPQYLYAAYALAGLCVGVVGITPFIMVKAFPADVRFTGISFSYNVAYAIFGGLTPICVTFIMKLTPMAPLWYVLSLAAMGFVLGGWLLRSDRRPLLNQVSIR